MSEAELEVLIEGCQTSILLSEALLRCVKWRRRLYKGLLPADSPIYTIIASKIRNIAREHAALIVARLMITDEGLKNFLIGHSWEEAAKNE